MHKFIAVLIGASILAYAAPSAFERLRESTPIEQPVSPSPAIVEVTAAEPPLPGVRSERLRADPAGHFSTRARLNGRSEDVLVDTGATYVAIGEATARRLGLVLTPADYRHRASTANGEVPVAIATLDRIEIGRVLVRDVEVMVTKGEVLPVTLLGMSFLKKLKRFEVEGDRLDLIQ